jgi:hypothetical protein
MPIDTKFLPDTSQIPDVLKALLQQPPETMIRGAAGPPLPPLPDPGMTPLSPDQQGMVQQLQQPPQAANPLASILSAPIGNPTLPHETKGHKLLQILMAGGLGAAAGAGQHTFGGGFQVAQQNAIQRQAYQQQIANLPWVKAMQGANLANTQAETNLANQRAQSLRNPQPKQGITPEEQTFNSLIGQGMSPMDAFKAVQQSKQDVKSEKPDTATQLDQQYDAIRAKELSGQPLTPQEKAFKISYRERKTLGPYASAAANQPNRDQQRSDKSYQFTSGRLDKMQQPVNDAISRLGRLQDTLNQNSPQADALIAPELLTVMAGGQGSGLRMNEAEISRIVGGRSNWQSLQAAANKWRLDPSKANSITLEQRTQIRALVTEVQRKLQAKQAILDSAGEHLISSDDPQEHRRIIARTKQQLSGIDQASGQSFSVRAPNGTTYTFDSQEKLNKFKSDAGIQ